MVMLITEMGGKMKKLLLGAMMAALFMSGDAEAWGKKTLKKQAQQAANQKQDVFIEQKVLSEVYYNHFVNIQTMLRGHISVIGKQETQSDSNVKDLKSLLQANANLVAKIISTGQQSKTRKVKFNNISTNIQKLEADVVSQLNFFREKRLESLVHSSFIKDNYKKWTDDFDEMADRLERTIPKRDNYKFLLKEYYLALRKFVSAWDFEVYSAYKYRSDTSKKRGAYNMKVADLSKKRKYGYDVPENGQMSQNIRTNARAGLYNNMSNSNAFRTPLRRAQSMPDINDRARDNWNNTINGVMQMQRRGSVQPTPTIPADYSTQVVPVNPVQSVKNGIPPAPGEIEYVNGRFIKKN